MNYNIIELDKELANYINGSKGKFLKETLKTKIEEQELMLDLFKESIKHCNKQIQLCVDKAVEEKDILKKQKYYLQKVVFEDNRLIWNISGFITLISIDIKTIQIGMYFAETEWHKRFYARQVCTIMYESANDIFELLGKDFKELISKKIDITFLEPELKNIRSRLNQFRNENSDYLCTVRNNTSAHKEKDVLKQLEVITDINWSNTIQITIKFEGIINDLGAFLQNLIKMGLTNLKDSPIGQKEI